VNTQFDEWLRALARGGKGPAPFRLATRGRLWRETIRLPGNWAGAATRAQIRLYPDAPGAPLATCLTIGPFVEGDTTVFILQLGGGVGADSTGNLPGDPDGGGVVNFAIDVLLAPAGESEKLLFGGIFELAGRVTA